MNWIYTNIQHEPRLLLGLSPNEYCVLDVYYQSQVNPLHSTDGWSTNSYAQISAFLGFSKGAIHKMVDRFVDQGLMEVNPANPRQKRTTINWFLVAYERVQKVNDSKSAVQKVNDAVQKVNANRSKSERHYKEERKVKENLKRERDPLANSTSSVKAPVSTPEGSEPEPFDPTKTPAMSKAEISAIRAKGIVRNDHPEELPRFVEGEPEMLESILSRLGKDLAARQDWSVMASNAKLKMTKEQFWDELKKWAGRNQNDYNFYLYPTKTLRGGKSSFAAWLGYDQCRRKYGATAKVKEISGGYAPRPAGPIRELRYT